jgi:competence protein ComEC
VRFIYTPFKKYLFVHRSIVLFWLFLLAITVVRLYVYFSATHYENNICIGHRISGTGNIVDLPEIKDKKQILVIKTDDYRAQDTVDCGRDYKIRIQTAHYPRYNFGDQISFIGKLSRPINFKNDDGREFNYRGYLAKDDIFFEIKNASTSLVKNINDWSVQGFLYKTKTTFVNNLNKVLGEPYSALASGLVVGEKGALGKELLDDFRKVGLIHIIVLSGFNITIVADALRKMLSFLPRTVGIFIGGMGLILFGIMVGGGATVVRSCFMASLALFGEIIRRDYKVMNALMVAGMIMIIINPSILLYDPSFQLSFLATLGLILFASEIDKVFTFITDKFGIRGIVSSSLATQLTVAPFILYTMGQISVIGILANILILPFVPFTMLMVFLSGATGFIFYPVSQFFGWLAHILLAYELYIVDIFSRIKFSSINVPKFSMIITLLSYGIIFCLYAIIIRRRRLKAHENF